MKSLARTTCYGFKNLTKTFNKTKPNNDRITTQLYGLSKTMLEKYKKHLIDQS